MGRSRLTGCRRSASTSSTSFSRYPAEDNRQKLKNAPVAAATADGSVKRSAKTAPTKTMRFFVHCFGRRAFSTDAHHDGATVGRGAKAWSVVGIRVWVAM